MLEKDILAMIPKAVRVLAIVLMMGGLARAQEPSKSTRSKIDDQANLFGRSAVAQATSALGVLEEKTGVPVEIETVDSLMGETIEDAAIKAAKTSANLGVFVLIAKSERRISRPIVDSKFAAKLTEGQKDRIREAILSGFKAMDFDEGLRKGIAEISVALGELPEMPKLENSSPLIKRDRVSLTLAGARKAIEAAEAKASEMKLTVNIAVVDDGGHLLAFARMDGGRPASAVTAQTKAISAATYRQDTGPLPPSGAPDLLLNIALGASASVGGARITPLRGGIAIVVDGQVIGGIGVGGGTGEQDAVVARAGLDAILREVVETRK